MWSNIEIGLGITAGSLATLRPLLRYWLGSHSDPTYPSGTRKARRSAQRPLPLGSLEGSQQKDLRPDKLAVMVTNIESQGDVENTWTGSSSANSSKERLNFDRTTSPRKMEVGIHQTFEVTQMTSNGEAEEGSHHFAREHV